MAKKGLENFTDKVAKDLIKKQSIRDEQRKIREEYLENKYKEASDLTNDIEVYIESLNNIININPNRVRVNVIMFEKLVLSLYICFKTFNVSIV